MPHTARLPKHAAPEARALLEPERHGRDRAARRAAGARSPRPRRAPGACRARRRSARRRAACRGAIRSRPRAGRARCPRSRPTTLPAGSNVDLEPGLAHPAEHELERALLARRRSPRRLVPAARPISKSVSRRSRMRAARDSGVATRGALRGVAVQPAHGPEYVRRPLARAAPGASACARCEQMLDVRPMSD